MAEPGWPWGRICARVVGEDPSCFLPFTGTHGARWRLPWALDNPSKASILVRTTKEPPLPVSVGLAKLLSLLAISLPMSWWEALLPVSATLFMSHEVLWWYLFPCSMGLNCCVQHNCRVMSPLPLSGWPCLGCHWSPCCYRGSCSLHLVLLAYWQWPLSLSSGNNLAPPVPRPCLLLAVC